MTQRAAGPDRCDQGHPSSQPPTRLCRRSFLTSAGSLALSLSPLARPALAASADSSDANPARPVRVTKDRLDTLAAKFHAVFNEDNILAPFSAEKHAARFDVELRRITTFSRVPETGERVKV